MLKIYNTLARDKQVFTSLEPGKVRMYVCGMTVYDYCHLGHARVMVIFDVVQRWLRASGYDVTYVRNITDIDDKIIKRAQENNETMSALTERFISAMDEDAAALGVQKPTAEPRATEYVPGMLDMISLLKGRGYAYQAADGDVNYAVRKFDGYGKLSGKSLEDLRAGERVAVDAAKQDPLDFVLWKRAKPGEPAWESPWGAGRPGWHIECSVMSGALLGKQFDIHGGGQDLQFPHHENEIAQSEGAHGGTFVNYWMHNGFVRVDNEKMSKSLGNFFTVRDILKVYDPEVVRFFIIRAHYRSPLNYSDAHLDDAKQALSRLYTALKGVAAVPAAVDWSNAYAARFKAALDDDFNTPEAVAVLFELAADVNRCMDGLRNRQTMMPDEVRSLEEGARDSAALLRALGGLLGLLQRESTEFLQSFRGVFEIPLFGMSGTFASTLTPEVIDRMINDRVAARKAKNFAESDRIRDELKAAGIVLEDGPQGTTWRRS